MRVAFASMRIEDRLQLAGRGTDDLEHVGGRRLLLQRFAQLIEQPGVLDSDDGLGSEVFNQLDLFVRKWPYFFWVNTDGADDLVSLSNGTWRKSGHFRFPRARPARVRLAISSFSRNVDRSRDLLCAD